MKRWTETRAGHWLLGALAWTLVGCIFALPSLSSGASRMALLGSLAQWWSWGLVTPLIVAFDRRLPLTTKQLPLRMILHLAPSLIITSLYFYVYAAMRALLGMGHWNVLLNPQLFFGAWKGMGLWSWLVYWLIVGALQAYLYYQHYLGSQLQVERLERTFSEARLHALRMQLDPHFLFNALNTISSHVERDPRLTRTMIEHLGDLLRMSLESKDRQQVPLAEELSFLDHYLAIQKIRFGDQLAIELQIQPETRYAMVPSLLLQPLVENAVRHGVSRRSSGGKVIVSAERRHNRLEIRIEDDGVGLPAGWSLEGSSGLGLSVTRERIAGLYADGQGKLSVAGRAGGGTEVAVTLPFATSAAQTASLASGVVQNSDARTESSKQARRA